MVKSRPLKYAQFIQLHSKLIAKMSRIDPRIEPPAVPDAVSKSMLIGSGSPWLIVLVGGLVGLAGILILGFVLSFVQEEEPLPEFEHQVMMPDGTLLVVEAVSWGKYHDRQLTGMPRRSLFSGYVNDTVHHGTSDDKLVVFMRRFNPQTHESLDFTWWGRSRAIDSRGGEVFDTNPHQQVIWRYGTSSNGGNRPLPRPDNVHYYSDGDSEFAIVAHSEFPALRVDGDTFHLIVENLAGEVVAEFDLPYVGLETSTVWAPEELPVTRADGAAEVTLTGVRAYVDGGSANDVLTFRRNITADVQFRYGGQETTDWYVQQQWLTDPLGNSSDATGVDLSWGEPAWKLHLTIQPNNWDSIPLQPGESDVVGTFALPTAGNTSRMSTSQTVGGTTIDWHSIGGPDSAHSLGVGSEYMSSSTSTYFEEEYISIELDEEQYGPKQLYVRGNVYCLVGINTSLGTSGSYWLPSKVEVKITAPDGTPIPAETHINLSDLVVVVFKPPPGITEVTATLQVRKFPEFEFLIAPPPLPTAAAESAP